MIVGSSVALLRSATPSDAGVIPSRHHEGCARQMPPRFVVVGMLSRVEQLAARQAHNLKAGGSSPPPATEFTCEEAAAALRVPLRTMQRHVVVLAKLRAPGIRRGQRPDMARWGWLVSDELLDQWKRGEVPAPWASALTAATAARWADTLASKTRPEIAPLSQVRLGSRARSRR